MIINEIKVNLLDAAQATVYEGQTVRFEATFFAAAQGTSGRGQKNQIASDDKTLQGYTYSWEATLGPYKEVFSTSASSTADWDTTGAELGNYTVKLTVKDPQDSTSSGTKSSNEESVTVNVSPLTRSEPIVISPDRSAVRQTDEEALSLAIRVSSDLMHFNNYQAFIDSIMCEGTGTVGDATPERVKRLGKSRSTPFPGVDAYQLLKTATEVYTMLSCGVLDKYDFTGIDFEAYKSRHSRALTIEDLVDLWTKEYLEPVNVAAESEGNGNGNGNSGSQTVTTLPYLALIRHKLRDVSINDPPTEHALQVCLGILQRKLTAPCFVELIWSYWHEEAMLVQTLNTIGVRFQNQRASEHDPLAQLDIDPLRPLNNLLWGYIQDEQHRLTLVRRAYEYDHHYGITLQGKAVPTLRSADSRSKFLEAFHNLLHASLIFYKQDDNTMVKADGFSVLNGLKEVHLLLAEGMHNQYGDLPSTARQEMFMQQWILSRPEMREFIGGRTMMPYTEEWMDRVDAMKKLQGWTDVSVTYFSELARFGEQLLLSIRYGNWSEIQDPNSAVNWAREWRAEVQRYVHAYRTVTGVDLSPESSDIQLAADRYLPPSVHLQKRLQAQRSKRPVAPTFTGAPMTAGSRNGSPVRQTASTARPSEGRLRQLSVEPEVD